MKQLLMKNKKEMIKYFIGAGISIVPSLMITLAISYAFNILNADTKEEMMRISVISLIIFLSQPLLFMLSRAMRIGFMRDIVLEVRKESFEKISSLSIQEFGKSSRETYLSETVSDLNLFEKDFFLSILNIISSGGTFIIGVVILWFFVSPTIALSAIAVTAVLYLISRFYESPVRGMLQATQNANSEYNIELSNVLNGLEVMKLYQVEEPFKKLAKGVIHKLETIKNRYQVLNGTQTALTQGIASAYQVIAIVYATYLWTIGRIEMGALVLSFNLLGQMVWSFISVTSFLNRYKASLDVYNRLTSRKETQQKGTEQLNEFKYLKIYELGYTYGDKQVFENLNFNIEKGSKTLIYGPSGIGKTTLLNCITQTFSDYKGRIEINGVDLQAVAPDSYLKKIGYIRQHHFMFEDSIKNNVILNQDYKEEKLIQVLKDVDLLDWVQSLEEGIEHQLKSNGSNISGGQKQRLSIARELYRDCEVLFVDEPSASLDDQTSEYIYDTLLLLNRTIICVSHRHLDYLKTRFNHVIDLGSEAVLMHVDRSQPS